LAFTDFGLWHWLVLLEHELFLFAAITFVIGALDDGAIDCVWLWLRLTGKGSTAIVDAQILAVEPLGGRAAVLIPAWQEHQVIAATIEHALAAWPQGEMMLYVGCYRNDPATISAVGSAVSDDRRLRLVICERDGPTTKADCLNRLFHALLEDEQRERFEYKMVVFHDAEDLVDPAALALLDQTIGEAPAKADFVQLPVMPLPQRGWRWLGSHYCEEFAEAHGKAMLVRDALGAGLPSAGVGCAISRRALELLREGRPDQLPFEAESLTEDYEMGLSIAASGGICRFVRARDRSGRLIATRAYFPSQLGQIVRQKTRWIHGISLQGWDRLGWNGSWIERWMRARDRRGPLSALTLFAAYSFLLLAMITSMIAPNASGQELVLSPTEQALLLASFVAILWRTGFRFAFTARDYGVMEGLKAVARIPFTNVVAIMAGRRSVMAYIRSLAGKGQSWDKTSHDRHPAHDHTAVIWSQ
jgi:adsorption protein B